MASRSRLEQRIESQTKRNVILSVIGITVIVWVLWKYGVPLMASASFMLAGGKQTTQTKEKPAYVAPPTLNDTFNATNSATVSISGVSIKHAEVTLYVNNTPVETQKVSDDNIFSFDNVTLHHGNNSIQAKAKIEDVSSDYSNIVTISYLNSAPQLSIDSPSDGTEFHKDNKSTDIKGKTDPGIKVTVNDFWAIVDTDGNYSYTLQLHDGDNDVKVVATDDAGNKAEKAIKLKYSQ